MKLNKSLIVSRYQQFVTLLDEGRHKAPINPADILLDEHVCLNCQTQYKGNFCPNCGQKATTKRLSVVTAFEHLVGSFTNLERGFIHTACELFYRPGYLIRDYFNGHRSEYSKPLSMLFVLATIQLVVHYLCYGNFGFSPISPEDIDLNVEEDGRVLTQVVDVVRRVTNYLMSNQATLTLGIILCLVIPDWLVFKMTRIGRTLNIIEHFYAMLFIGCQLMLFNIVQIPFHRLFGGSDDVVAFFSSYSLLFMAWDFKQLLQIRWLKSIFLLIVSFILSFILGVIVIICFIIFYSFMVNPEVGQKLMELSAD